MKIYLLFPPHWTPTMPHLALPVLTGAMRRLGHTVIQRDLNVEVFDEILTRRYLRQAIKQVRTRFGPGVSQRILPYGRPSPEQVTWALETGSRLADQVENAKTILRSPAFYQGASSEPAIFTVVTALELAALAHYPARLELTGFSDPGRPDCSGDLFQAVRDPQINPFYDIFSRGILQDLRRDRPDLVGISIPTQGQFLAGLTLAALIRDAGLKCHITVGGPHITMLREQLPAVPKLFELIDSAVLFDGEIPLQRLTEALASGTGLETVPNLVYRGAGPKAGIHTNPGLDGPAVRAAAQDQSPDFEGLPFERYLAPELVLPLATSHGCYHGKCGFCNVGYGSPFHYFPHPVEQVVAQVESVRQKYNCHNIFFVDEAITPRTLRLLSTALAGEGQMTLNWVGAVRFEKALNDDLLADMARSGCRMLLFGLESASEPVMQRMIKGTLRAEMGRVLQSGSGAGIWNHTFFFFGFPGETMADAQETVNFIYAHQDAIHSASPGAFLLERYSPAQRNPGKFGIRRIVAHPERDLAIYFEYELVSGLDEDQANALSEVFLEQLPEKRYGQFYVNDVYRFLYAGELHRRGLPLPRWIE
jgi:hypothetical protein